MSMVPPLPPSPSSFLPRHSLLQQLHDTDGCTCIQAGGGLVQTEDVRGGDQLHPNTSSLLLPSRHPPGVLVANLERQIRKRVTTVNNVRECECQCESDGM